MTAKTKLTQGLIAGAIAVAFAGGGLAIAQSNPPSTGSDPATAAGQQSTQATPMGSTGTPAGDSTMSNTQLPTGSTRSSSDTPNNTPAERDAQADPN